MKAVKIKMKYGCGNSNSLVEIDQIYITGCTNPGYFKKEVIHDYLKSHPNSIRVNVSPYPFLEPVISANGEKYVRSNANNYLRDNLLNLPRE